MRFPSMKLAGEKRLGPGSVELSPGSKVRSTLLPRTTQGIAVSIVKCQNKCRFDNKNGFDSITSYLPTQYLAKARTTFLLRSQFADPRLIWSRHCSF